MDSRHGTISLFMNTNSTWAAAGWTAWWAITLSSCKAEYSSRNCDSSQTISSDHSPNSRETTFYHTELCKQSKWKEKTCLRRSTKPISASTPYEGGLIAVRSPLPVQSADCLTSAAERALRLVSNWQLGLAVRLLCQAVCLRKALPRPHVLFAAAMAACKISTSACFPSGPMAKCSRRLEMRAGCRTMGNQ